MTEDHKKAISEGMKAAGIDNSRNFRNLSQDQEAERRRKIAEGHLEHGCRIAPKGSAEYRTYTSWASMRQRCDNPRSQDYPRYGGRGITVCPEWYKFENFLADMGLVPPGFSIERIDNSLGYSKGNCQWASKQQQARNRRSSKRLTINGVEKTLAEWAESTGLRSETIRMRIKYNHGVVDESILRPVND